MVNLKYAYCIVPVAIASHMGSIFSVAKTEHYRLDWHRFNLKQRLLGRLFLTAEEFEAKSQAGEKFVIRTSCP